MQQNLVLLKHYKSGLFQEFRTRMRIFWEFFWEGPYRWEPLHVPHMQQNLLLRCRNINKVVCFLVLNENENFWGRYSENSDLTRLVGRHSFGGWKTDTLHKQTFQKVNKNWTSFHTRCLRTTGRWVATAIFCQENQLRMQCCVSCLSKRKLDGSLQI